MTQPAKPAPLRVGVIGAGWPGERHAEGYLASGLAQVVAVSDLEAARRAGFAASYAVPTTYADYNDLLADPSIEAVSIALPNFLHAPATIAALEAGKHVLCEKPPAVTLAEAQAMAATADRQGLVLAFAHQRRFNPSTEALRKQLAAGALGEVYHSRAVWTRTWGVPQGVGGWFIDPARAGGGALIDIGIHVMDLAWFLMGCPVPATVSGQVYNKFPELTKTDDSAFALIRFADGRSLQVESSWVLAQEDDHMGVHLYGTGGGAHVDDYSLDLYTVSGQSRVRTSLSVKGGLPAFTAQAANFARAVRGEEPPRTPASHGVQVMTLLEAIYRSGKEGREVVLSSEV
jgi:predicted dehydrogenase